MLIPPSRTSVVGLLLAVLAGAVAGCSAGADATASDPSPRPGLVPQGETRTGVPVDRVVDGDTIHVLVDGDDVTVRMIGINTPETVKPESPVECFGPESSDFAKQALTGASVTLEFDDSQGRVDQYDRTLAYVWVELDDGGLALFNEAAIAEGFAYERQYGGTPYRWKSVFDDAEDAARAASVGLWGACPS